MMQESKTLMDIIYTNQPQNLYMVLKLSPQDWVTVMIDCVRQLHNYVFL